jgi:hypothetical protein
VNAFDLATSLAFSVAVPEIVKIATTLIPGLKTLPVLGKIIPLFQAGEMNTIQAEAQYQADKERSSERRTRLKQENNKHVIKISDAMECVENALDAKLAIAFLKGTIQVILGGTGNSFDTIFDPIASCMQEKALQQKNLRSKGKYVKTKGTPEEYTELISLRKGKLHPFIPEDKKS